MALGNAEAFAASIEGARGSSAGKDASAWHVDRDEALRYLGYAGQDTDALLDAQIDEAFSRCEKISAPGFVWRAFPVRACASCDGLPAVHLAGSTLALQGRDLAAHLEGAVGCAVMACTLGLANEREMRRLSAADVLQSALFGAAGSSLVESVANACEADIAAFAARIGLRTNWRFSPGYGDAPLFLQPAIVRVLEADRRLGMTALEGGFVAPAKSVTAFVGLFDGEGRDVKRSCAGCVCAAYCELRKAGTPCYR